jgi:dTDP-4-dehydrorhamnose reductase
MKNILILGSNGMLGYAAGEYFSRKGYNVKALVRSDFDAVTSDITTLIPHIENADLVLNCIGVIKQVIDKYTSYETIKINGILPRNLARLCKQANTAMIHITTDCAYSGKRGAYNENDILDAEDLYGVSKVAGETKDCMTLRTSIIGPERKTNRSLLGWAMSRKGKTVKGFTNHKWNGVTTLQFAKLTEKIMLEGLYEEGLFHLHSTGTMSKYEMVSLFNEIFSLGMTVDPVEAAEFCDRSLSSLYPLSKNISTLGIKEQVKELKEFFNL